MIMKLYTIRDRMTEFGFPMPFESNETAKRYFRAKKDETKLMRDNPKDFTLWYTGLFNTSDGTINAIKEPILVDGEYIPYVEEDKNGESL